MAVCPSCNAPLKDGDWTCGACGAPVAGAGVPAAPGGDYHATYGGGQDAPADPYGARAAWGGDSRRQPAAPATDAGASGTLKLVFIIAAVAVLAIVLVWFFLLRGPATTGEEFLGTWTATTQQGIATAVIAKKDDAFAVTLSGSDADQRVSVPAHVDGTDLVITLDDFSQIAGEVNAERFRTTLKALAGDFKLIISSVDATHLDLRIVGTSAAGQDFDETIPLVKDTTGTA